MLGEGEEARIADLDTYNYYKIHFRHPPLATVGGLRLHMPAAAPTEWHTSLGVVRCPAEDAKKALEFGHQYIRERSRVRYEVRASEDKNTKGIYTLHECNFLDLVRQLKMYTMMIALRVSAVQAIRILSSDMASPHISLW